MNQNDNDQKCEERTVMHENNQIRIRIKKEETHEKCEERNDEKNDRGGEEIKKSQAAKK